MVFSDAATCADLTGADDCGFVMCDFVPEGKTFEETCGPYFQDGFTISALDEPAIDTIISGHLISCWNSASVADRILEARDPDDNWVRISGPESWLDSVEELIGADCEA